MKKLLALLMALLLVFSFAACGGDDEPADTKKTASTGSDAATETGDVPPVTDDEASVLQKFIDADAYNDAAEHIEYDSYGKMITKMMGTETLSNMNKTVKASTKDGAPIYYSVENVVTDGVTETSIEAYENGVGYYSDGESEIRLKSECTYEEFRAFLKAREEEDGVVPSLGYDSFEEFTYEETDDRYIGTFSKLSEETAHEVEDYFKRIMEDTLGGYATVTVQVTVFDVNATVSKAGYVEKMTQKMSLVFTILIPGEDPLTSSIDQEITNEVKSIDTPLTVTLPFDKDSFTPTESLRLSAALYDKVDEYFMKTYGEFETAIKTTGKCTQLGSTTEFSRDEKFAIRYIDYVLDAFLSEGDYVVEGERLHMLEYYKDGTIYTLRGDSLSQGLADADYVTGYLDDLIRPYFFEDGILSAKYQKNGDGTQQLICDHEADGMVDAFYAYRALSGTYANPDELWESIVSLDTKTFTVTINFDSEDNVTGFVVVLQTKAVIEGGYDIDISYSQTYTLTRVGGADIHPIGSSGI